MKKMLVLMMLLLTGCEKGELSTRPGMADHRPITSRISQHGYANTFYILAAGQSNMWGQGMMNDPFPALPQIFVYPGTNPSPQPYGGRIGPAYAFALDFSHDHPTTEIVIIPCSVRGSPATDWIGGGTDFNACIQYWREAGGPGIDLILYMQGEAEGLSGDMAQAEVWPSRFTDTVNSFRSVIQGRPRVVYAQIGPNPGDLPHNDPVYFAWQTVQEQQNELELLNVKHIMTWDLPLQDGWVHFTKDSYFTIGTRMYQTWQTFSF